MELAACFYVQFHNHDQSPEENYRAIYPKKRTVDELTSKILQKSPTSPAGVARVLHVKESGLQIVVDDEFVQEIPEGQSMLVKILTIPPSNADSERKDTRSGNLLGVLRGELKPTLF